MAIMIAGDQHDLRQRGQLINPLGKGRGCRSIVDEIANKNQIDRFIIADQFLHPALNGLHPPQWKQIARSALTQFKPEMEIGHREPTLSLMEKRQTSIEQNVIGDLNPRTVSAHTFNYLTPFNYFLSDHALMLLRAAVLLNVDVS